jgi:hypothetical protein
MELLVLMAVLTLLALLAHRYGRDSRDWRPGQGLVGWANNRSRRAQEVVVLDVVYPELAFERARALWDGALRPGRPRRLHGADPLPRKLAVWSGMALVRCGQALIALAVPADPAAS